MNNLEIWEGELSLYHKEDIDKDDEVICLWETEKDFAFKLGEGYKLVENEDGYGNIIYTIEKG